MQSYQRRSMEIPEGDGKPVIKTGLVLADLELMIQWSGEAEKNNCAEYISCTPCRESQGTNRDEYKSCNCPWGRTADLLIRMSTSSKGMSSYVQMGTVEFHYLGNNLWSSCTNYLEYRRCLKDPLCMTCFLEKKADLGQTRIGLGFLLLLLLVFYYCYCCWVFLTFLKYFSTHHFSWMALERKAQIHRLGGEITHPLSSAQVAGMLTEGVGKPVHIPALPTGIWTHIFTTQWYKGEVLFLLP